MPEVIRIWKELVEPFKPEIQSWEQLDTLSEPQYVKVFLRDGAKVIIKQDGTWVRTWRYEK